MNFKPNKRFLENLKERKSQKFLIPEYQRPYRWGVDECEALWDDMLRVFDDEREKEYFLGSIVSFENDNGELEIIDGQQRITTLTLLFRAFYENLVSEESSGKERLISSFADFIWESNKVNGEIYFDKPFLQSRIIGDDENIVLKNILSKEINLKEIEDSKSNYAKNFLYFKEKIKEFKQDRALSFEGLCTTILGDTFFVLFVTCDSQESATTIFNTLNSRGKPLSNADILKGRIYKSLNDKQKGSFAKKWNEISNNYEQRTGNDISELFVQFMHVLRAEQNDTDTTTSGVLDFFSKYDEKSAKRRKHYGARDGWLEKPEKIDEIMEFLEIISSFWLNPKNYLSPKVARYLNILDLFQNDTWKFFVSFLVWRNKAYFNQDEQKFSIEFETNLPIFIKEITAELLKNNASTNTMKYIVFKRNAELNQGNILANTTFNINKDTFLENIRYFDARKVRYILFLYTHLYDDFSSDLSGIKLDIEHILPKKWQNANFECWDENSHAEFIEQIGNKILLEKKLNISCANGFFAKKQTDYKKSVIKEALTLGNREKTSWDKDDIKNRNEAIFKAFESFLS